MNEEVTAYIKKAPEHQRVIMETIRSLIHDSVHEVSESFKWGRPIFSKNKDFAYLQANKNHVNLGFYKDFEKLNDPDGELQGTGKTMRHIKISMPSDINIPRLTDWMLTLTS